MMEMVGDIVAHERMGGLNATKRRHIVILNWRDLANPRAGGAEKVTHEIARRWVQWGHRVTLFCASYPGALTEESVDGIQIIRRGRQHTVHWAAYCYYRDHLRGHCDIVVDEVNTIPFFAPLYAREPVLMFSHQLAREIWRYEAPFPLSTVGYLMEPMYLQAYRHTPVMTVSHSTRDDLRRLGLQGPCYVIPEAVDTAAPDVLPSLATKEHRLTLIFVGRVVPSKRVDHIVRALKLIQQKGHMDARLWIVGSWDDHCYQQLTSLIAGLRLEESVTFWGRVDDVVKEGLMARAHVFVMTSVREGWGLVVTEANRLGTPAVVYDVAGLRDSTLDGETGLICQRNTPFDLACAVGSLYDTPDQYDRMRERAWTTAKQLNWEQTARDAWRAVESLL